VAKTLFTEEDLRQIEARGMTPAKVISQIEAFKKGFPHARLLRPCTVGEGITVLKKNELDRLGVTYSHSALSGRAMKFVPASGAASRMFKLLFSFDNQYDRIDEKQIMIEAEKNDPDHKSFLQFIKGIKEFAFYHDLKEAMSRDGLDVDILLSNGQFKEVLEYLLTPKGLHFPGLPKGLVKFHTYPGHARTPIEEHLVEAASYTRDRNGMVRVHFTVSPEHQGSIKDHISRNLKRYEKLGAKFELTFSVQKASTGTIAADMDNEPFRDRNGRLVFRPAGHGALLENLSDLHGDIVFIKNIDNVVPDRLKQETYTYKRALGGYLVELQRSIFGYLERLSRADADKPFLREVFEFVRHELCINPPENVGRLPRKQRVKYLVSKLNRPLRVCGMVRNEGEPGGGPFWVQHTDQGSSLQIVESPQVDMGSAGQRAIWESSIYFNPVDLVCGVRDYLGRPMNLMSFTDPDTGFISIKSLEGKKLKALELPGLWNGAMTDWNTVFIEVPIITFNPVKTLLDLLRKEHRPE
jgi:hypothetical protein